MINVSDGVSLVLSGGAARGAFHLGVLQAIDDVHIKVKAISGSSIGAVVGAGYLSGNSPKKLLKLFNSRAFKSAIKLNLFKGSLLKLDADAPIMDRIVNDCKNIEDLNAPLHVSVTDIGHGRVYYKNSGDLKDILLSTCALVPLFPAQKIGDDWFADGGIIDNFPVESVLEYNLPIIGINLHPNVPLEKHNMFSHMKRAIFLGWHSGVARHLFECDYYLAPKELCNFSILGFGKLEEMFELGQKKGEEMIESFIN